MKALFAAMNNGIGKSISAIYPIVIFKLKDGISYSPKDPNYDLRLLAEKTLAKRQFPNFSNLDAPYNLKYYKEGHPETEVAYMGMAAGSEVAYVCSKTEDPSYKQYNYIVRNPKRMAEIWDELALEVKTFDSVTEWKNLEDLEDSLYVCDSTAEHPVKVKKMMRCSLPAKGEHWCDVALSLPDGTSCKLVLTSDHPLCVVTEEGLKRVPVKDLKEGDLIKNNKDWNIAWKVDRVAESVYSSYGYDFETESDRFDLGPIVSHNCRTRVIANVNGPEIVTSRGNLSFTTLNLPRLAIEASQEAIEPDLREGIFFKKLDEVLDIATRQLQERFEIQCKRHVYNFPYVMQQGAYMGSEFLAPTDKIEKAILNGTLSFGFVGLAEALVALTGHDHSEGPQYQQLGLKIIKYIRDYADKLTEERHMNWTLIATPAESVAGRFLRLDRAKFGVIPGVTDKD